MSAYYNENDPKAAAWLRELIANKLIAQGDVDERDIRDIKPLDLLGYDQCHFFAGIGGWSVALRLADWPDDKPVWTGSCPCQPFSAAGKGAGFDDERHLWPAWFWLIEQCRPERIFGEQVASKAALDWFDLVSSDLEATGYAVGAVDIPACGVGAPHIRNRLWWVADAESGNRGLPVQFGGPRQTRIESVGRREAGELVHPGCEGSRRHSRTVPSPQRETGRSVRSVVDESQFAGAVSELEIAEGDRRDGAVQPIERQEISGLVAASAVRGFWSGADWLPCADGKARPVEPGTFPLDYGLPARVGRLRGYGNAIVPQAAAAFIEAYLG